MGLESRGFGANGVRRGVFASAVFLAGMICLAGSVPAGATTPAGNDLKKACGKSGLMKPKFRSRHGDDPSPFMTHPGKRRGILTQVLYVEARYEAMPRSCKGKFERVSSVIGQLQDSKHPKRWIRLINPKSYEFYSSNEAGWGQYGIVSSPRNAREFYKCLPGPRKARVRVLLRNKVIEKKSDRMVHQRFFKIPATIEGGGC
jgi:hypothetical protein